MQASAAVLEPARLRDIARVVQTPAPAPGFIGPGHLAVEVLRPNALDVSDPFVLLMDDRVDIGTRRALGGPHPHAGLETVTLVLAGVLYDSVEGELSAGDAVWMTAGRGVVHNEHVEAEGKVRVLQLWIGLPARARFSPPAIERLPVAEVPVHREGGVTVRLYSGRAAGLRSSTRNLVPVTLADIVLEPGARMELEMSAQETGFLYVLDGELTLGDNAVPAREGDVAWLDRPTTTGMSRLPLAAGPRGARAVLYAGEPHGEALVQRGPFVADSPATLTRFSLDYQAGRFPRLSELAAAGPLANAGAVLT